ncbi:MAG: 16S rRNA (cytosine(1402)-N(4))-methyltransferase RsmH [Desulfomicrobium sp.]|nr:16S rRNA (cytosine(1402)-N(4))-methyltransferase RsmH [Pseudomonadota bacterium]MBU4569983.1 16S rRNA (cytosine(1402)-N(4))-methyltransferase RsmH [Pseudomonadota bacterium]MBU4595082.1 16S rRNA (cytosine(1402)-N(4))-methyltransferase RsmH [Pseudomonadota bacterium]MBV1711312.1 16S rRNA (cytosine(1402)-N(4))-methyltransferase RsmH [Desulfomicrobium sp.]MBV1746966.1 16S rRNA (cytosine(1402)-N(4))-methyltransferase RsmH [Desulfomicrobium sp.]
MDAYSDHIPVMLEEVMHWIAPKPGGVYMDATLGLAGHAARLMDMTGGEALLLGLDRDEQALAKAGTTLARFGENVQLAHTSFQYFSRALREVGWDKLDGVIADLGVSSLQLDSPERGFSFLHDGPLDMRMDPGSGGEPAAGIVNGASFERLRQMLWDYGEEPMAGRIARAIVAARETTRIESTLELARIVAAAYPAKRRALSRNHPATKTFQALRLEVNQELREIEVFLERIVDYLRPGARIAVISFHSLEDRIVKRAFRKDSTGCLCPREYPLCQCGHEKKLRLPFRKPLLPSEEEMRANSRSRSAKLRVAERIDGEER